MMMAEKLFQSTRPVRGATQLTCGSFAEIQFQSTRPVRGATSAAGLGQIRDNISIHAPRAGRDVLADGLVAAVLISIHAPRAGRDR